MALSIATEGFDARVASTTGNLFGAGTYLTNSICKAHMYTDGGGAASAATVAPPPPMLLGAGHGDSHSHHHSSTSHGGKRPSSPPPAPTSPRAGGGYADKTRLHQHQQQQQGTSTHAAQTTPPVPSSMLSSGGHGAAVADTHDRILVIARVVLGVPCVSEKAMPHLRRPPPLPSAAGDSMSMGSGSVHPPSALTAPTAPSSYYDSVVGNGKDHKEFVVYDRGAAYPFAVVRYRLCGVVQQR